MFEHILGIVGIIVAVIVGILPFVLRTKDSKESESKPSVNINSGNGQAIGNINIDNSTHNTTITNIKNSNATYHSSSYTSDTSSNDELIIIGFVTVLAALVYERYSSWIFMALIGIELISLACIFIYARRNSFSPKSLIPTYLFYFLMSISAYLFKFPVFVIAETDTSILGLQKIVFYLYQMAVAVCLFAAYLRPILQIAKSIYKKENYYKPYNYKYVLLGFIFIFFSSGLFLHLFFTKLI